MNAYKKCVFQNFEHLSFFKKPSPVAINIVDDIVTLYNLFYSYRHL